MATWNNRIVDRKCCLGRLRGLLGWVLVAATIPWSVPAAGEQPCADPRYAHGISHLLPLQYDSDFTHFAYANPDAPKAGEVRVAVLGTFDNYNGIIEKGRLASGYDATGGLVYDRLLEPAIDEPVSYYVRLAEGVVVDPDFEWVAFRLRADATWHDGAPITAEDVLFTFEAMQEHGSVALRTALADLDRVFAFGDRELCFVRKQDAEINPTFPFTLSSFSILPKHYWSDRDIEKTTVQAPLGSGPYRLARAEIGRLLVYERHENYWGRDIPVNKGRYNFQRVKLDHFADEQVMIEAHKGHVIDIRQEGVSKNSGNLRVTASASSGRTSNAPSRCSKRPVGGSRMEPCAIPKRANRSPSISSACPTIRYARTCPSSGIWN